MELNHRALLRDAAFVDGQWVQAADGERFAVHNPADGTVVGEVPDLSAADAEAAVESAQAAWADWRAKPAKSRAKVLRRWFELITAHRSDLASLMTAEQGKPLGEAAGEVIYSASFVEWYAEQAKRVDGEVIPTHLPDRRLLVIRQPVGVVACITPWNFPLAMITRKAAPALAAGCPVLVKPAEDTPLSALALAALAQEAGLPAGLLNILTTTRAREVGEVLTSHPLVRKFSFTGSTAVGKQLMAQCAGTVKKVSLELGGNAPFIVFDDADLDAAVQGAIVSKYRNAGQTCVCANRVYVQAGVYDAFLRKFTEAVKALKVGRGEDRGVDVGPLISGEAVTKVERLLADAVERGGEVATGGTRHELGELFFEPTVLAGATAQMALATEEIFGPVAPVFRFEDEQEVVELANATDYGLAAYFYARDIGRVWRVAEALEYGMVCINDGILSTESAPFGGVKESGIGREGGKYGIEEFLELKYLTFGGLKS